MENGKIVSLEDRIPKLKQQRRKKANRRLILLLIVFFLLIGCVLYFQSSLSKVNKISIVGNSVYTDEQMIDLSGLSSETNIWKVDKEKISIKIEDLNEVKSASVQVQLPNRVVIRISEWKRIAFLMKDGGFLPILENGEMIEDEIGKNTSLNAPVLIGFSENDLLKNLIQELTKLPEEVFNSISEIHYTPKETDKYHINLYMNDGFEVSATLRSFASKMSHYPSIVSQLDPNIKGIIDMEVGSYFRAYDLEGAEEENEKEEG